jgi:mRNA interferase YafQ
MKVKASGRFKKDFKNYRNIPAMVEKIYAFIDLLRKGKEIPKEYLPHKLEGIYKGCMECHIENDLLIIWINAAQNIIKLIRLGSHSELF